MISFMLRSRPGVCRLLSADESAARSAGTYIPIRGADWASAAPTYLRSADACKGRLDPSNMSNRHITCTVAQLSSSNR